MKKKLKIILPICIWFIAILLFAIIYMKLYRIAENSPSSNIAWGLIQFSLSIIIWPFLIFLIELTYNIIYFLSDSSKRNWYKTMFNIVFFAISFGVCFSLCLGFFDIDFFEIHGSDFGKFALLLFAVYFCGRIVYWLFLQILRSVMIWKKNRMDKIQLQKDNADSL